MTSPTSRIIGLDALRCCAILGVLVAHSLIFLYPHIGPVFEVGGWTFLIGYLGHGGFYGVELFFVLSGFLIGRILLRTGEELREGRELLRFWTRRWWRTLPAYFLFLAINVAVIRWVFPAEVPWGKIAEYLLFLPNLTAFGVTFFHESWSLAVEEWFYLLFPAVVCVLLRLRWRSDAAFLGTGALFYVSSTWFRWQLGADAAVSWGVEPRMITFARFDALMVGIFAAWWSLRHPEGFGRFRHALALIGLVILGWTYVGLFATEAEQGQLWAGTLRFNLVSLGFGLLLPWGQHCRSLGPAWFDSAIRHFACWSYAMYLCHMLVLRFLSERWLPDFSGSVGTAWLAWVLFWVITIGFSALVYRGFERPCTALRDRFSWSREA